LKRHREAPSWIGVENGRLYPLKEGLTLTPISSKLGTCQGHNSFTLTYQTLFKADILNVCWPLLQEAPWSNYRIKGTRSWPHQTCGRELKNVMPMTCVVRWFEPKTNTMLFGQHLYFISKPLRSKCNNGTKETIVRSNYSCTAVIANNTTLIYHSGGVSRM